MEYAISAKRPAGRPRRPKTYSDGRVCASSKCNTNLSRYNQRDYCHVHAPIKFPRVRGRIEDQ